MTEESDLITESDLGLLLTNDVVTCNRLADSLAQMAAERLGSQIKKSRPYQFKYYFRKGKETKVTQHDWDDDFKSAVGMGIAHGFDEWRKRSKMPTNPTAFISYVLSCVDTELANVWRQKRRYKRLSESKTANKLRFENPALVEWIEDKGKEQVDLLLETEGFDLLMKQLDDDERAIFVTQLNVADTARRLGLTEYRVKKTREKLRNLFQRSEFLAV